MKTAEEISVIRGHKERAIAIKEYAEQEREKGFRAGYDRAAYEFDNVGVKIYHSTLEEYKLNNPLI